MASLYSVGAVVIVIIILSSVFVIRNSFSISVSEKTKQYGMLSSIGATKKQIKKSVLYEGFYIGIIGIPLGILCGMLAVVILLQVVNVLLGDSLNEKCVFSIPILAIIASIVISAITIYLSCILPARRASKISPIEAIRGNDDIKIKAKKVKTSKITKKLFGIGGAIASKNLKRNKIIRFDNLTTLYNESNARVRYFTPEEEPRLTQRTVLVDVDDESIIQAYENEHIHQEESEDLTSDFFTEVKGKPYTLKRK